MVVPNVGYYTAPDLTADGADTKHFCAIERRGTTTKARVRRFTLNHHKYDIATAIKGVCVCVSDAADIVRERTLPSD